jgi:hypothetical protein
MWFEECGDAELLDLMGEAQQAERAAFARQLMAKGRFAQRRVEQMSGENDFFCTPALGAPPVWASLARRASPVRRCGTQAA